MLYILNEWDLSRTTPNKSLQSFNLLWPAADGDLLVDRFVLQYVYSNINVFKPNRLNSFEIWQRIIMLANVFLHFSHRYMSSVKKNSRKRPLVFLERFFVFNGFRLESLTHVSLFKQHKIIGWSFFFFFLFKLLFKMRGIWFFYFR